MAMEEISSEKNLLKLEYLVVEEKWVRMGRRYLLLECEIKDYSWDYKRYFLLKFD